MSDNNSIQDDSLSISDKTKSEVFFNFSCLSEYKANINNIFIALEKHSFARIGGLIQKEAIIEAKKRIHTNFDKLYDHASIGEDPKSIQKNFSKFSIGGSQKYGVYRPRCMRTIYNPMWDEDIFLLRSSFEIMAKARNMLYGLRDNFAIHDIEDDMWTASRIHHYPTGGGFLISHRDTVVPKVHAQEGYKGFYQLVMVLSKKGVDFIQGGGFATLEGERYFYENDAEYGDIVIYDGRTIHGVADIDPENPFDQKSSNGRMAGFVTLYKDIPKDFTIN